MAAGDRAASGDTGAAANDPARLRKRSVLIAGHRSSVSLEDAFWVELKRIARRRGESLNALITRIDRERSGNLSSALRVFALGELRASVDQGAPTSEGPA